MIGLCRGDLLVSARGARFHGRFLPCAIGRGGITGAKREGDGATPAGIHRITGLYYRPDRVPARDLPRWAQPIGPRDLWSDDPAATDYNQPVRAPYGFSHERLRRADPLYDLVLVLDWNRPMARPGHGSAIFIHRWRAPRFPTAGCVAFAPDDLRWLIARLTPRTRLVVRG